MTCCKVTWDMNEAVSESYFACFHGQIRCAAVVGIIKAVSLAQRGSGFCKPNLAAVQMECAEPAISFKGRGVCPSCNTRRMVETAAHLTDHVFPRLAARQWVLSVPKRLRYFMQRDGAVLNMVLRIFFCGSSRKACNPTALRRRSCTRRLCISAQWRSSTGSAPA